MHQQDKQENLPTAPVETGNAEVRDPASASHAPSSLKQARPQPPVDPTTPVSTGASLPKPPTPDVPPEAVRPRTRDDCLAGPRPCPWISCRWHLCWERREIKRAILSEADPGLVASLIMSMPETCVLDVCQAPRSDREVGAVLGVSHQAVAQACQRGLSKLRAKQILKRGQDEVCGPAAPPAWRWGSMTDQPMDDGDE